MKLKKIILGKEDLVNVDTFRNIVPQYLEQAREVGLNYSVKELRDKDFVTFQFQFWPFYEHTIDTLDFIRTAISQVVSDYIVNYKEEEILKEILTQEFGYHSEEEQQQIISYVYSGIEVSQFEETSDNLHKNILRKNIIEKAMDYFCLEHTLTMDGFIRFRLKDQWGQWRSLVEHAVDEYLAEKEYKEFIQLARLFLTNQDTKTRLLHIVHIDDRNLQMYSESWHRMSLEKQEQIAFFENRSKSYEDLLIGSIIHFAPEHIVIHTDQENHHIIYTLKRIFDQRTTICNKCLDCYPRIYESLDYFRS